MSLRPVESGIPAHGAPDPRVASGAGAKPPLQPLMSCARQTLATSQHSPHVMRPFPSVSLRHFRLSRAAFRNPRAPPGHASRPRLSWLPPPNPLQQHRRCLCIAASSGHHWSHIQCTSHTQQHIMMRLMSSQPHSPMLPSPALLQPSCAMSSAAQGPKAARLPCQHPARFHDLLCVAVRSQKALRRDMHVFERKARGVAPCGKLPPCKRRRIAPATTAMRGVPTSS